MKLMVYHRRILVVSYITLQPFWGRSNGFGRSRSQQPCQYVALTNQTLFLEDSRFHSPRSLVFVANLICCFIQFVLSIHYH